MEEQAINISSINRQKVGRSKPEDFTIKYKPSMYLDPTMKHELAVDRVSMTYSWHNINATYNNNTIKYSKDGGSTWKNIIFVNGMYSYDDLSDFIEQVIKDNGDSPEGDDVGVKIYFVLTSYRVVVELGDGWQLDIRNSTFGDLIGFKSEVITSTGHSSKLPNITNSIDSLYINCDLITDSITDGIRSNTLCVISCANLTRSYPFQFEPRRALFSTISKTNISEMRIEVRDSLGRPIDLNGIDWHMTLILRSSFV